MNAVAGTDYPVLQQVKDLITTALQNSVYRVGSYYVSDDSTNPLQVLGFGTWVRVSGFVAGAGNVAGGPGIASRTLTAGQSGGLHGWKLSTNQIPLIVASVSGTTGSSGTHRHAAGNESPITDSSVGDHVGFAWGGGVQQENGAWATGPGGAHTHPFSAQVTLGQSDPGLIDNMPPFTVTNIWKRTA